MSTLSDLQKRFYEKFLDEDSITTLDQLAYQFYAEIKSIQEPETFECDFDPSPLEEAIDEVFIEKPVITSPVEGGVDFSGSVIISTYTTGPNFDGVHTATEWQVASDINFTNITHSGIVETATENVSVSFTPGAVVYIRVRYESGDTQSPWSDTVSATTSNLAVAEPTVIDVTNTTQEVPCDAGATNVPVNPVFLTSPLTNVSGVTAHVSTDWTIKDSSDNVIFQSLADTENLTTLSIPMGILDKDNQYRLEFKYNGDNADSPLHTCTWTTSDTQAVELMIVHDSTTSLSTGQYLVDEFRSVIDTLDVTDVGSNQWERFSVNYGGNACVVFDGTATSTTIANGRYKLFVKDTLDQTFDFTSPVTYTALSQADGMKRDIFNAQYGYKVMGWTPDDKYFYLFDENNELKIFEYSDGDLTFVTKYTTTFTPANFTDCTKNGSDYYFSGYNAGNVEIFKFDGNTLAPYDILTGGSTHVFAHNTDFLFAYSVTNDNYIQYDYINKEVVDTSVYTSAVLSYIGRPYVEADGSFINIPLFPAYNVSSETIPTYLQADSIGFLPDPVTLSQLSFHFTHFGFDEYGNAYLFDYYGRDFAIGHVNLATIEKAIVNQVHGLGYRGY